MSFQITEAFVQQFADNIMLLSQQRGSILRNFVRVETGVVGKRKSFERIAATSMVKRTSRHGDTPLVSTPHSRRWANIEDYDWSDLVDEADKVKMLISPESSYAQNAAWAAGRTMDDVIIKALLGVAVTGEEATGTASLPAGQKIAAGAAGLTLAKIRAAAKILNKNEVLSEDRFFVINAESLDDLLGDTNITSADFNSVRLLMAGTIDAFMGFRWLRTERLTLDGDGNRQNIAYQRNAIGLAISRDLVVRISERPDKNYSTQVYLSQGLGAVRVEDEAVVEIAVIE